jgi:hypothetical protein
MREIRPSGSEGGGTAEPSLLPLSALPAARFDHCGQKETPAGVDRAVRGGSPLLKR